MADENITPVKQCREIKTGNRNCGMSCGAYGIAFIGAAVYYIQQAASFWEGVLGVLKALVWPAMLVYKALEFFKM